MKRLLIISVLSLTTFLCLVAQKASAVPVSPVDTARAVNIYRVNKYILLPSSDLDSLGRYIDARLPDIRRVRVGGSASPEGPVWWNLKLGEYRAEALSKWLLGNTQLPSKLLETESLGEDWQWVVRALEGSSFPHRDRILQIIASEPDWESRKNLIRRIDGGRTWWKLVREVFPPIRNSRVLIIEHAPSPPPIEPIFATLELPADESSLLAPSTITTLAPAPTCALALKTNLIFAGALVANLGVEVQLHRHWSLDIPVYYSPYDITPTRKIRLLSSQPELRYWFKEAMRGLYVGAHATVSGFNVAVSDRARYQDPEHALWGVGVGLGWATHLDRKRHWGLELNIGAGMARYKYDEFRNVPNGSLVREGSGTWWGPTRAGITISYQWRWRTGR